MAVSRRPAKRAPRPRRQPKRTDPPSRAPERLTRRLLEDLMFGSGRVRRFTQDSPVLPDVWLEYAGVTAEDDLGQAPQPVFPFPPAKLLLTPFRENASGDVRMALVEQLEKMKSRGDLADAFKHKLGSARVAYNLTTVAATLHFEELVRVVLPMTDWWAQHCEDLRIAAASPALERALIAGVRDPEHAPHFKAQSRTRAKAKDVRLPPELLWTIRIVGTLALAQCDRSLPAMIRESVAKATGKDWAPIVRAFLDLVRDVETVPKDRRIYSVSRNRVATASIARSTLAVKADAARRLFDISAKNLAWAVIDSGIDAQHPAFR